MAESSIEPNRAVFETGFETVAAGDGTVAIP
jgi:hypothetical protein